MTEYASADVLTRYYLYGTTATPAVLTDRLRDLEKDETHEITLGAKQYVEGYARYAVPSRAAAVRDFFNGEALAAGRYTVAELITRGWDPESFSFSYVNAFVDARSDDFLDRSYVFGSVSFHIREDAVFVVDANGQRHIENVAIVPDQDNFDFWSTYPSQALNDTYLKPTIDPYGIGRTVIMNWDLTGIPVIATYDRTEFDQNVEFVTRTISPDGPAVIAANIYKLVDALRQQGVFAYEIDERDVIYDGLIGIPGSPPAEDPDNEMTASSASILVAGGGEDTVTGSAFDDIIYGGSGADTLTGGSGSDVIYSNVSENSSDGEADILTGGEGSDIFHLGNGDRITDIDSADEVWVDGVRLIGGEQTAEGSSTYKGPDGATYTWTEGSDSLTVKFASGSTTTIDEFQNGDGGITLNGYFGFEISSRTQKVNEGGKINLKLSLTGAESSDGFPKDIWVYVSPSGSATNNDDFAPTSPQKLPNFENRSAHSVSGPGFWVKIPSGQGSIDISLDVKKDSIPEGTEEVKFSIGGYRIVNRDSGTFFYTPANYRAVLSEARASEPVEILDDSRDVRLSASGGYEGYSRALSVTPGSTFALDFEAFDIPDHIRIWDASTGSVYVDTGFMSYDLGTGFTVDENSEGTLRVAVLTNNPGTAWNLDLLSQSSEGGAAAMVLRFSAAPANFALEEDFSFAGLVGEVVLDASGGQILTATISTTSLEESSNLGDTFDVSIDRSGNTSNALTIGWRVEAIGDSPVDASDFGGIMPSGLIELGAGEEWGNFFFDVVSDEVVENAEQFRIVLFDPITGAEFSGVDGAEAALVGQILPRPEGRIFGTGGDDVLQGSVHDNTMVGQAGNDTLTGGAGDDYIEGNEGNDTLTGGAGRNYLIGGTGADTYRAFGADSPAARSTIDDESSDVSVDVLDLGEIGQAKLDFIASGADLIITNLDTLQAVRVVGQFDGRGVEQVVMTRNGQAVAMDASAFGGLAGLITYHLGDGDLNVDAVSANSGARLIFGAEFSSEDLDFYRHGSSPRHLFIGTPDGSLITIVGLFSDEVTGGFAGVTLPDGGLLSVDDLRERAIVRGTAQDDTIFLIEGDDRVRGGLGNDALIGGAGSDEYLYALGDGQDVIFELRSVDEPNVVRLTGIMPSQVTVSRVENSILLELPDGGSIMLDRQLAAELPLRGELDPVPGGVGQVVFDDGTIWDAEALKVAIGFVAPNASPQGTEADDVLVGDYWVDDIAGGAGDDQIDGGAGSDRLEGGAGNDTITGGEGRDFLFGGEGSDQVLAGSGDDYVDAGDGDAADDFLQGNAGSDTLDYSGAASGVTFNFTAGTASSASEGTDSFGGFEILVGSVHADQFNLDGSAVEVEGGGGADVYTLAGTGSGRTLIFDWVNESASNRLVLDELDPGDVVFTYDENAQSLLITVTATGAVIELPIDTISVDAAGNKLFSIGEIAFANGTIWGAAEISSAAWIRGSNGDDELVGTIANETFDPGAGNDTVRLGSGNDRVVYRSGDGNDTISGYIVDGTDVLTLAGLNSGDISFSVSDYDLLINVIPTGSIITLADFYSSAASIDRLEFADGTSLDRAQIIAITGRIDGTAGPDTITGNQTPNIIDGGAGNDIIDGGGGDDILIGGQGNDTLSGSSGNDVYRIARGDGVDIIKEAGSSSGGTDAIEFADGIAPSDILVTQADNGKDIVFQIVGTTDKITIDQSIVTASWRVESVKFADGTIWSHADLVQRSFGATSGPDTIFGDNNANVIDGGAGDDVIDARDGMDVLIGGPGNDVLKGGANVDTYVYNAGDGDDVIYDGSYDSSPDETLSFGAGILPADLIFSRVTTDSDDVRISFSNRAGSIILDEQWGDAGVEIFSFDDGTIWNEQQIAARFVAAQSTSSNDTIWGSNLADTISGGAGNDAITTGKGNDTITGGSGNDRTDDTDGLDTHIYNPGDGDDIIYDRGNYDTTYTDVLSFGAGIAASDLRFSRNAADYDDIKISFANQAGSIFIENQHHGDAGIEQVRFADGTTWSLAELNAHYVAGQATSGDDIIFGTHAADTVLAEAGNDAITTGAGNDTITGGAGNDRTDDTDGLDTHIYNVGDGDDIIYDRGNYDTTYTDILSFGAGIVASDIRFSRNASDWNDIKISFANQAGSIFIENQHYGDAGIEQVRFADGTVWSLAELNTRYVAGQATSGDDTINGTNAADTVLAGTGNDAISTGAGNDIITASVGNDRTDDTDGLDTHIYNVGDGDDIIYDRGNYDTTYTDILSFGAGIVASDIRFSRNASDWNDIKISFANQAGSIFIENQHYGDAGIEQVRFADGTTWSLAELNAHYVAGQATNGDDTINGTNVADTVLAGTGNDIISTGAGNDTITAGAGNDRTDDTDGLDTHIYNLGDGDDIIYDRGNYDTTYVDVLSFGVGILPSDIIFSRVSADAVDVKISFTSGAGSILLENQWWSDAGIEKITFADGTAWLQEEIASRYVLAQSTTGNDTIWGTPFVDIVSGGAGNDTIDAGGGNDTIDGDIGNDIIYGGSGVDTATYASSSAGVTVSLALTTAQNTIGAGTDTITATENLTGSAFNDILTGSTAANVIEGGAGDDLITGGLGNDTLNGGAGTDIAKVAGDRATYTLSTVNGQVKLVDNNTTADGNDGTDTLIGIETVQFKDQSVGVTSPIILDLDGDGVQTISASVSKARFDMNGDGRPDDTSWIEASDGFLFLDRDANGTFSGVSEMSFVNDRPGAQTDLEGLRAFDTNGDGVLSAADARFADFKVWRDVNGDGRADKKEILSLGQISLTTLQLTGAAHDSTVSFGDVAIVNKSSWTRADGSTMELADAAMTYFASSKREPPSFVQDLIGDAVLAPKAGEQGSSASTILDAFRQHMLAGDRNPGGDWEALVADLGLRSRPAQVSDDGALPPLAGYQAMHRQIFSKTPAANHFGERQVAMMAQDLASFSAKDGSMLELNKWQDRQPVDFFAA